MNSRKPKTYLRFLRAKIQMKTLKYRALLYFYFIRNRSRFLNNKNVRAVFEWLVFEWLHIRTRLFNAKTLAKYDKYSGRNR